MCCYRRRLYLLRHRIRQLHRLRQQVQLPDLLLSKLSEPRSLRYQLVR
jgi:hypothetical protein